MKEDLLLKLGQEYGTPSFIFNVSHLKKRVKQIKEILGEKIHLCYSIKANPFLIPTMLESVEKLEVCSPGELLICERLNVPGEKIIYSGVNKTLDDIEEAVKNNSGIYTAESILHVELLNQVGNEFSKRLPVLLRLNAGSQFGMSKEDLFSVIENRNKYSNIEIVGIHFFAGTQRKKLDKQKKELVMLKELYEEIFEKYNLKLQKLEYGPGLPVPIFEADNFDDTLHPMKELAETLKEVTAWAELTIEMGRFYVTEIGYYLTTVMDQKSNEGINYSILDGGMNHLNYFGQIMGMKIPVIKHLKEKNIEKNEKDWSLCGSLCTTADVIVRQVKMKDLERNDILAFCNVGAYSITEGIYLFLSRMMPRVILYDEEKGSKLVRDFYDSSILNTIFYK